MRHRTGIRARTQPGRISGLLLWLALSTHLGLAAAYNASGTVTAVDETRSTFIVDGTEYVLSSKARALFDFDQTDQSLTVGNLRKGEYVQLEAQGNLVTKVQRYRNGPPR